MAQPLLYQQTTTAARPTVPDVAQVGFWSAVLLSLVTAVTFAVAITTPPRSGPFCAGACITYPYTDVAAFFPRDYLWMYPALLIAPCFVIVLACIHATAEPHAQLFSMLGTSFAAMAAVVLTIDYTIQLTVIQPSLLHGEAAGLSIISQYNPHGIFIALEELGYSLLSVAFLFAAFVFYRRERVVQALRWLLLSSFTLAVLALLVLSLLYGTERAYRFEVLIILIDYLALIAAGILISLTFWRARTAGAMP